MTKLIKDMKNKNQSSDLQQSSCMKMWSA